MIMSRIAVLMGGTSGEREVSLKSGTAVSAALQTLGHDVLEIDVGENVVAQLDDLKGKVEAAFIALHGRFGEDGTIQGLLELLRIPYTGSGVMASAIAINKVMSKQTFRANAIPVAEDVMVAAREIETRGVAKVAEGIARDLGFPSIVKPNCEGSTLGVMTARNAEELESALSAAIEYDDLLLVERCIEGREMTVGLLGEEPVVLPVLEVVSNKGIYDYECKYSKGMTEYRVPAPIGEELARRLQRLSLRAHIALGCEGFSRVDFMVDEREACYCLEINTIPGMTELSLIPKAAAAAGLSFNQVVECIVKTARLKIGGKKCCHEK
jgi:D-alanine-D-alanine ligase